MKAVILCFFILAFNLPCNKVSGNHNRLIQTKYSKKAVRLVLKNRGYKVGSGTSLALLNLYEKKTHAKRALKFSLTKKAVSYIAVGDELVFSGTYKNNNVKSDLHSTYEYFGNMHYAIVVGIKDNNTLIIAHQNINEDKLSNSVLVLSELMIDDSSRFENINVYGLIPKRGKLNPSKLLRTDGERYSINSLYDKKSNYLVDNNYTH